MLRRRGPFGILLLVSFGVLLGAALFGGSAAVGGLLAAPFIALGFVFKIVLFFLLFGLVVRLFAGAGARNGRNSRWSGPCNEWWSDETRWRWPSRSESSPVHEDESDDDRFAEWHRMAHARKEVDDHTPPVED